MKDIKDYEGLYAVTEDGKIYSYKRQTFLKPSISSNGYYGVTLSKDSNIKRFLVHRLVATAYLDNPNNLPLVNHKDENKLNNEVSNLEWCTVAYNNTYGSCRQRVIESGKKVYCVELNKTFNSAMEASRELGIANTSIRRCCKGDLGTAGGYRWAYANAKTNKVTINMTNYKGNPELFSSATCHEKAQIRKDLKHAVDLTHDAFKEESLQYGRESEQANKTRIAWKRAIEDYKNFCDMYKK